MTFSFYSLLRENLNYQLLLFDSEEPTVRSGEAVTGLDPGAVRQLQAELLLLLGLVQLVQRQHDGPAQQAHQAQSGQHQRRYLQGYLQYMRDTGFRTCQSQVEQSQWVSGANTKVPTPEPQTGGNYTYTRYVHCSEYVQKTVVDRNNFCAGVFHWCFPLALIFSWSDHCFPNINL